MATEEETHTEVPLVIYVGRDTRKVIGKALVSSDGTMSAVITDQLFIEHLNQDMRVSTDPFSIYRFVQERAMANEPGESLGDRTNRPHHPDGWFPSRPAEEEPQNDKGAPPRGKARYGEHDRPSKKD